MPDDSSRAEERSLVIAAQAGNAEAFASLVRLHQRRAYAVCRAIVLTHEDAEDAVQDGFLHAYKALARFLPDQPFGAWLFRIMANASLDLVRRRKVRDADELPDTVAMPFMAPFASTVALAVSAVTCVRTGCGMTVTLAVRVLSAMAVSPATGAVLAVMLWLPAGAPVVLKLTV